MIEIYTDGSAKKNGEGGFGVVVLENGSILKRIIHKKYKNTTNNEMELTAILIALELSITKYKDKKVIIKSDSAYCVNGFNIWYEKWCANGWKRDNNEEIKNLKLIKKIYSYKRIDFPNFCLEKIPRTQRNYW